MYAQTDTVVDNMNVSSRVNARKTGIELLIFEVSSLQPRRQALELENYGFIWNFHC